jgi:hypothetical protein
VIPARLALGESAHLEFHLIGAKRQQRRAERFPSVCHDNANGAGVGIGDGDRHAGQHAALCVFHGAFDGSIDGLGLSERRTDPNERDHKEQSEQPSHLHETPSTRRSRVSERKARDFFRSLNEVVTGYSWPPALEVK